MKTFHGGGGGGRGAMRVRNKKRWVVCAWGLALAFVVGVLVVPSEASAGTYGGGWIPAPPAAGPPQVGGGEEPPPQPPKDQQECFEDFLRNQMRCKALWCEPASILSLYSWTSCQMRFLDSCIDAAEAVFYCCVHGGPSCG